MTDTTPTCEWCDDTHRVNWCMVYDYCTDDCLDALDCPRCTTEDDDR